jgi:hypothetical protein
MMNEKKPWRNGGKSKTAPYKTTHVRVPEPIKTEVQQFIQNWHVNNFEKQFPEKHAKNALNLLSEFEIEKAINWTSPRNDGLKKFRNWLIDK